MRRDARAVEWDGLENRCPFHGPRVRIPLSPQNLLDKKVQ